MNVHKARLVEEPGFLCDLLDGLESIAQSQYRAWRLAHDKLPKPKRGDDKLRLGWLGYDQLVMLVLDLVNAVDRLNANVVRLGGGKAKPRPILPPGSDRETPKRAGGTRMDLDDYAAQVAAFFDNLA